VPPVVHLLLEYIVAIEKSTDPLVCDAPEMGDLAHGMRLAGDANEEAESDGDDDDQTSRQQSHRPSRGREHASFQRRLNAEIPSCTYKEHGEGNHDNGGTQRPHVDPQFSGRSSGDSEQLHESYASRC